MCLFLDEGGQIGFQSGAIFSRSLEEQLDELTFARTKMPTDASPCQSVQEGDRLLHQELFELVRRHEIPVKREA